MQMSDRPIRVLCVLPSFVIGGAERVVLDMLKYMDAHEFQMAAVSLFPQSDTPFEREAAQEGLNVFYLSKRVGLSIDLPAKLHAVIRTFRPDVIHSHLYIMHYVLPVSIWNKIPVRVHTLHNPVDIKMPEKWRQMLYWSAFHTYGFYPVSISESVKESVQRLYGPIESAVIYNGTDTYSFIHDSKDRHVWRAAEGIAQDAPVFVNISRFHRQKNHHLLIDSFRDVAQRVPDALLVLVGSGTLRAEIEKAVADAGLAHRVRFLGDRHDIPAILNASDLLVSTSDWEGFGITVAEAMAAGKPVVATAVGGVPELVVHGSTGLLVGRGQRDQLTKALLVLCANPELGRWMGTQGRERACSLFDVRAMTRQYGQLYRRLLAERQPNQGWLGRVGPSSSVRRSS